MKTESGKVGNREGGKRKVRACRRCGCTYHKPCGDKIGQSCCWVAPDLCSSCLTPIERKIYSLPLCLRLMAESLKDQAKVLKSYSVAVRALTVVALKRDWLKKKKGGGR